MPLTITDAVSHTPAGRQPVADWRRAFDVAWDDPGDDHYRGVLGLMFTEARRDPRHLGARGDIEAGDRVIAADGATQVDLARDVAGALLDRIGDDRGRCALVLYASASLDEEVYVSPVGRLTADLGLHGTAHFSVGQLQGASLAGALDIADAMLAGREGAAAMLVAAERWPQPAPRLVDNATLLADGAAALWLSNAPDAAGLRVLATVNRSCASFLDDDGQIDADALAMEAGGAIRLLVAGHSGGAVRLLPSELGPRIDRLVAEHAGVALSAPQDGSRQNRLSVAAPARVAAALADLRAQAPDAAADLIAWGASYAGGIGAALLRPTEGTDR